MTPPDDLLKRARQIHRTDSREIIEELAAALESDRALLRRLVEVFDGVHSIMDLQEALDPLIDEIRARVGQ